MFTIRHTFRLVPAAVLLAGCGGADLVLPGEGEPATIAIVQGDEQSGPVGVLLAQPVVARVTDSQRRPVSGVRVAFAFTGDPSGATVAPDTAETDGLGQAAFRIVLGTHVGGAAAEVRVASAGGERVLSAPLRFDAVPSDANQLVAVAGDGQAAPAGGALPSPLVVQVTDAFGNPISGVEIAWAADAGSVTPSATVTGTDGLVSAERTLGVAAGVQHATATAPGLAGSPVTFTHRATSGSATVLERVSGDGQSALAGTSVPDPLVVQAKDGSGNPVADLAITWVIGNGGGSLAPETSRTDAQGRSSTRWTLGATPGANTATAVVSGVGTVGFTATGNPGTPPALSLVTEPPGTAKRGVVFSRRPVIQLRDPDGVARRMAGVAVNVSLAGGGTLRGTSIRSTGSDGRVEFDDLTIEGPPGAYTLAFAATGYGGVRSGTIQLSRAPTTVDILSDDPDPSASGATVRVRFQVRSPGGTPTGTVRVRADDGAACEASVADGVCTLAPTIAGSRTLTATYSGAAEFESSGASTAHEVKAPTPMATTTSITADDPDPSAVGQPVAIRFTVTVTAGASVPAGTVTVTASGGGSCTATVAQGSCDLTLLTEGSQTLTAVYAGSESFAGSSDTEPHAVAVPSPSLSLRRQPSSTARPAHPFKDQPEVQLLSGDGKPLERSGVTVTASLASGSGSLTGAVSTATDDKGRVKFRDLGIDGAKGDYTIQFSADGFTPVTSNSIELR